MAGLSGKSAWFGIAKQTVKGTAITTPAYKSAFSGGTMGPRHETDRLAETDAARDQGAAFNTSAGVEGSPELYARLNTIGAYLYGVMGTDVVTGTTPNYTHTITPGATLPWWTMWRNVGGAAGLFERYTDCMISSMSIAAEAGQPLTATLGVQGITPERLTTDPAGAVPLDAAVVPSFNQATITLGGTATALIRSFEFGIDNNITPQQTDDFLPYDLGLGQREISLGFDMYFADVSEYSKFHYGGAAGTQISQNIFVTSANLLFTIDANNSLTLDFPSLAYEEFPVEPNTGGDPVVVSARAVGQKATGVTNLVTATLKNTVASY